MGAGFDLDHAGTIPPLPHSHLAETQEPTLAEEVLRQETGRVCGGKDIEKRAMASRIREGEAE